ncbi:MAG: radical SAM protein [Chloroflexi bacterium]|nr:radical SAM protein [Chloroflexota bacterium]MCI0579484.1 radical SAM protein [Chloroflexota bacterium]MCI0648063.1 radical SAM protein [Chloroflexota bacterium]MCI0730894.1 radical SAM protein [Chloroflexota bacterium]
MAFSPYAPAGPSVLDPAAWERWQSFSQPQPLSQEIDRRLAAQALLQPVGDHHHPQYLNPETLTAWLHVTNACNLDCPYCYVRKSSERMSEATGLKAIEQIFYTARRHHFQRVKLKYAGGEATLHFKLVRQLHQAALALAEESCLALREVVLSNGYHIRAEDADWLAESGVKLMISLDGVGEAHNRQRPLKGGGDTFDQVEKTVDQVLLPRGIRPDITITLTRLNASGAAAAVRWALERDLPVSLNFYRQNILSASRAELELEEQAIIGGMLAAYNEFEAILPTRPFFNGLLDRVQAEAHAHTCGVQHSYLVLTHQGKLAQCQMHLDSPVSHSLAGDLLPMVATGPIQNISVDDKDGCRACEFRYRCSGGCPLETYRATGRWDVQSPHCHIYKTLLPAALRLEGLRLLKAHRYI